MEDESEGMVSVETDRDNRLIASILYSEGEQPAPLESAKHPRRGAKRPTRSPGETLPLLNEILVEIESTMDLLALAREAEGLPNVPNHKVNILCRKVSRSLRMMEDLVHRIAKSEGSSGKMED